MIKISLFASMLLICLTIFGDNNSTVMLKVNTKSFELTKESSYVLRMGVSEVLTKESYALIDEASQEEALKEQSEQREKDCFDEMCLVDTGKMLAAKEIFLVEIVKMGDKYVFALKNIDIETGTTKKTKSFVFKGNINDGEELLEFSKTMTIELFSLNSEISKNNIEKDITNNQNSGNINENPTITNSNEDNLDKKNITKKKGKGWFKAIKGKWSINLLASQQESFGYDEDDEDYTKITSYLGVTIGATVDFINTKTDFFDFTLFRVGAILTTFGYLSGVSVGIASSKLKIGDIRLGVSFGPFLGDMQIYFIDSDILVTLVSGDFSIAIDSGTLDLRLGISAAGSGFGYFLQTGATFNF